eukprot:3923795-Amphidinium_carterae.1
MDVEPIHIPPPPGLDIPSLHPEEMAPMPELPVQGGEPILDNAVDTARTGEPYKPTHSLTGKQPPPQQVRAIVARFDNIADTKEIHLENNEDKEENRRMESIMSDVQVQPWFQYEDDITMFSEHAVKDAMNKELSRLINEKSFVKVDKRSLTAEQLQHVVATRRHDVGLSQPEPATVGQRTSSA